MNETLPGYQHSSSTPVVVYAGEAHFFHVRLDVFDGPLDLLLHLVKQNELPVEKISLAQVASQFMQCVEVVRSFDLDVAGEYLVIAATLLSIKSCVLLNAPVELVEDEEGYLVNPHDELLRKLRELEIYKDGVRELQRKNILGQEVFARTLFEEVEKKEDEEDKDNEPQDALLLARALQKLLQRVGFDNPTLSIQLEEVSIVDRMWNVLKCLEDKGKRLSFEDLIPDQTSRSLIIGTFLALLELCKRQLIRVEQGEISDKIYVNLLFEGEKLYNADIDSDFDAVKKQVGNS